MRLGDAFVRFTDTTDGDLGHGLEGASPAVERRRLRVLDMPWSWLHQAHGARVVVVEGPMPVAGDVGDALVTLARAAPLAVFTADCAPVALVADNGAIAAVHAGWRGLVAGVIQNAVDALRTHDAVTVVAALGPCIHAECYEFSSADLDLVESSLDANVRGLTNAGKPALDLPAGVRHALRRAGVELVTDVGVCTSCSPVHYSHRARREPERQAMVVWRE